MIQWGSLGVLAVNLSYSFDDGQSWTQIAEVPSKDGVENRFSWITPQPSANPAQCFIQLADNISGNTILIQLIRCDLTLRDGDLNNDCLIDLADFAVLSENWLLEGHN